jgi:hypothetical protein
MTTKKGTILALTILLGLSVQAGADEVTDQLASAKTAYDSGQLRSAVEALNFASAKIQEQITASLLTLLPEPLAGWQADPPQAQSGGIAAMVTGTTLSRRYVGADGAEVTLNLMADSPMMPMLTMAMSMPAMMQGNPNMKVYSFKGNRGTIEHAADSEDHEITLMVGNRLLIQSKGTKIKDSKPIEQYLEALDLEAIQKALTN